MRIASDLLADLSSSELVMNTLGRVRSKLQGRSDRLNSLVGGVDGGESLELGEEWRGFVTKRHRLATLPIFHSRTVALSYANAA